MTEETEKTEKEYIDCTPDWEPLVRHSLGWIKDAIKYEKQYRKDCTDYDKAMEGFCSLIVDCAKGLDKMNRQARGKYDK